jgi:hypothetical protein
MVNSFFKKSFTPPSEGKSKRSFDDSLAAKIPDGSRFRICRGGSQKVSDFDCGMDRDFCVRPAVLRFGSIAMARVKYRAGTARSTFVETYAVCSLGLRRVGRAH